MTNRDVVIVGAGIFGNVIACYARRAGYNVTVVGESRPYQASPASGCVLAPNWLNSMSHEDIGNALSVLKECYEVVNLEFQSNMVSKFKAKHVNPDKILQPPDVYAKVTRVDDGVVHCVNEFGVEQELRGTVIVAAGIWSKELITDMPDIKGLYGASFRIVGQLSQPKLHVYAPYRQSVGFNIDAERFWFGDGSALTQKTWLAERVERTAKTLLRAASMSDFDVSNYVMHEGARPYVEGHKAGYLRQVSPQLWVSTGGAKNGTVLAASHAYKLVEALK